MRPSTGSKATKGWEPSGDDWWWPPTELGLADTSWLCDSWVLELRGGDAGPEYAGTADLYYSPAGYIKQDYLGVWRMEDDCLYLKLSADSGDAIDASFPILISPSGEDLYFQRSRTGAGTTRRRESVVIASPGSANAPPVIVSVAATVSFRFEGTTLLSQNTHTC